MLKSVSRISSAHNLKGMGKKGGVSDDSLRYALTHISEVTGFRQSDAPIITTYHRLCLCCAKNTSLMFWKISLYLIFMADDPCHNNYYVVGPGGVGNSKVPLHRYACKHIVSY